MTEADLDQLLRSSAHFVFFPFLSRWLRVLVGGGEEGRGRAGSGGCVRLRCVCCGSCGGFCCVTRACVCLLPGLRACRCRVLPAAECCRGRFSLCSRFPWGALFSRVFGGFLPVSVFSELGVEVAKMLAHSSSYPGFLAVPIPGDCSNVISWLESSIATSLPARTASGCIPSTNATSTRRCDTSCATRRVH